MPNFGVLACLEESEKFVVVAVGWWCGGGGSDQFYGSALVKLNNYNTYFSIVTITNPVKQT